MPLTVQPTSFGKTGNGDEVTLYTCTNAAGWVMRIMDFGAIMVALEVPDRNGKLDNVTLGFNSLDRYVEYRHPYFGATVGRYCNRIARGKFKLNGKQYQLATNNGPNHLHGGTVGFDKQMWNGEAMESDQTVGVRLRRTSPDGEEGYPGELQATVEYVLTGENEFMIHFSATTDAATVVNLTNHNYWNLAGAGAGTILDHELQIAASQYLPVDETLIPTGQLVDVAGTPLDFTQSTKIGARIQQLDSDPVGYDHCFSLADAAGPLKFAARAKDAASGRVMEVYTTQPGIQFYSGNFLSGADSDGGYNQYAGFCLETQHYPDSPNQDPNRFPSTVLEPGTTFRQTTVHKFLVE